MKEKLGPGIIAMVLVIVLLVICVAGWKMFGPTGGAGTDNEKEAAYIKAHPRMGSGGNNTSTATPK